MGCFKRVNRLVRFFSFIHFLSVFLLSVLLVGCLVPAGGPGLGLSQHDDEYYDGLNRQNRRRSSILSRSRDRYRGEECEEDEDCEDICRKIYRRTTVRDECLELPVDQVEQLEEIYEALERPHSDELDDIDAEDFETFVSIDLKPLNTLVGRFNSTEGKKVLAWIAQNSDIAKVFIDVDREYDLLEELLDSLDGTLQEALDKTIDEGQNFMELAIADGGSALDWVHNFILEDCSKEADADGSVYEDQEEVCVLQKWYCEVLSHTDERTWSDLVRYDSFAGVANEILSEYTSGSTHDWWDEDVREDGVEELRDADDFAELCPPEILTKN